jgi:hypothetical protein
MRQNSPTIPITAGDKMLRQFSDAIFVKQAVDAAKMEQLLGLALCLFLADHC